LDILKVFKKDKDERNPPDEKDKIFKQALPDIETDPIPEDKEKELVDIVIRDAEADRQARKQWVDDRATDIKMYESAKPSEIENLAKEDWQADRNLGLCAATCDTFQATLLATCYNAETLHPVATEENKSDLTFNIEKFAKWMVGENECDCAPEVDDYIHNNITQGVSFFKVRWEVWYEWIDRRIPKYTAEGKFNGYDIKTEYKRFTKGVLESIDDLDDILYPAHGDTLQNKDHIIHVLHKLASDLVDEGARNIYKNIDDEFIKGLRTQVYESKCKALGKEKLAELGILSHEDITVVDLRNYPIDLFEWYGKYELNGKREEYRVTVEPSTKKLLAIKPLRKITRTGKRPFVGSGFIRRPGSLEGKSLPRLIAPICNAFNNVFNQKSDFQYTQNVPFGIYKPDENFKSQTFKIKPGDMYPSDDPQSFNFPNMSRNMAWATYDIELLLQMLEKMTGAASYFMNNTTGVSGTATRDMLINQKSETRFGLWVTRIIADISEALTMLLNFYQEWASPELGERILGEEGKQVFKNFSIEAIRGGYKVRLSPDVISGSKTLEREIAMWGLETLSQTVWFNPQVNPLGNWKLVNYAAKKMGFPNIDNIMPPEPKADFSKSKTVTDKLTRLKQGEALEVEEGDDIAELFFGFSDMKDSDKYFELDKEYRPNFDIYFFKLSIAFMKMAQRAYQEQKANELAMQMIGNLDKNNSINRQPVKIPPAMPVQPQPGVMPNGA
jgi:hypothetical protein